VECGVQALAFVVVAPAQGRGRLVGIDHHQRRGILRRAARQQPRRPGLEHAAQFAQLAHLRIFGLEHERAALRMHHHEALGLQLQQGLAHRRAAHAQLLRQVLVRDARAQRDAARGDALADLVGDARLEGAGGRRR
jgi:hypothetical protein